jgi:hypothetical protein
MHHRYRDFKWKPDAIVGAILTWRNWPGFTAERCTCGKTANVLGRGPGWFCVCGEFNIQDTQMMDMPHDHPHLGPDKHVFKRVRAQLTHPPYVHRYVWVRRRQPEDRKWQIVWRDRDGVIHRPKGYFYTFEGNQEEADLMIAKLQRWESHRDHLVMAEVG